MNKTAHCIISTLLALNAGCIAYAQQSCDSIGTDYSGLCIQKGYEKEIVLYENGQRLGALETYYKSGQLKMSRSKEMLTSRTLEGEFKGTGYARTGVINEKIDIVNGTGTIELFYEDTIELRAQFYQGRPTGTWKYFFFGQEEKHIYFDSSRMNSYQNFEALYDAFKEYENLLKGISRDASTYNGLYREYHSKGNLFRESNYVNGKLVDTIKTYSRQGYLSEEASVSAKADNKDSGFAKWYDSTGNIHSYFQFENGTGIYWEYSAEEQVSYTGYYKDGIADGVWLVKDANGSILREIKSAELSSIKCITMGCIMENFANNRIKMRKIYNPDYVNPWDIPPPKKN